MDIERDLDLFNYSERPRFKYSFIHNICESNQSFLSMSLSFRERGKERGSYIKKEKEKKEILIVEKR